MKWQRQLDKQKHCFHSLRFSIGRNLTFSFISFTFYFFISLICSFSLCVRSFLFFFFLLFVLFTSLHLTSIHFNSLHFFFFLYHLSDLFLSATDLAAKGPVSEDTQAHHKVTDCGSHILEVNNYYHDISNSYRDTSLYYCLVAFWCWYWHFSMFNSWDYHHQH